MNIFLAKKLICVVLLRKNRKWFPVEVKENKLKKEQFITRQREFITILKWHDKSDVLMLSTCHGEQFFKTHEKQIEKEIQ